MMSIAGAMISRRATPQNVQKIAARTWRNGCCLDSTADRKSATAGNPTNDEAPGEVGEHTDEKEEQRKLSERMNPHARRVGQCAVQHRSDGCRDAPGLRKDRMRQNVLVADDEKNGDRFAERASPSEQSGRDDAGSNVGKGHDPHRLVAGHTKRKRSL